MLLLSDPFEAFQAWFDEAEASEPRVHDAVQIATVDAEGAPTVRTVLLKGHGPDGFVFFTNTRSRKGQALASHARVAGVLHWKSLERQVVFEGRAQPVSDAEADAYFASRPRGSQVGAWASAQSEPVPSRDALQAQVVEAQARFAGSATVPRPPWWSGFRIVPHRIEFWQGMPDRLHVRTVYARPDTDAPWTKALWQP